MALWSKKLLVIPVAAALTAGGIAIAAVPANAAPADLTITSSSVTGRTFTVSGAATTGDSIQLLDSNGDFAVRRTTVANGMYTMTYTIPGTATGAMNFTVQQVNGLNDDGSLPVTADVPAAAAQFAVTTPADGSTVDSRTVTFTGTGVPNQPVNVLDADGNRAAPQTVSDDNGNWTTTGTFSATAPVVQNLSANQLNSGMASVSFTINLPAVAPADQFSLTSPTDGQTVDSRTVTFTGTGTPGDLVNVLDADGNRAAPQTQVDADGNWTVDGTFSDTADVNQDLSVNQFGGGQGQGDISFSIVLPAAATPPGDGGGTPPGDGGGTPPGDGGTGGTGTPGTGTGTGTATPTGTDPGAPALPVVSG